mmetsp:Transcript_41777/g.83842  ORF Transcript_41777/g.83842 Transcript_41777/m.83842 type:complete len:202 (+) Transcript_41777:492-1097(+)
MLPTLASGHSHGTLPWHVLRIRWRRTHQNPNRRRRHPLGTNSSYFAGPSCRCRRSAAARAPRAPPVSAARVRVKLLAAGPVLRGGLAPARRVRFAAAGAAVAASPARRALGSAWSAGSSATCHRPVLHRRPRPARHQSRRHSANHHPLRWAVRHHRQRAHHAHPALSATPARCETAPPAYQPSKRPRLSFAALRPSSWAVQ